LTNPNSFQQQMIDRQYLEANRRDNIRQIKTQSV